MEEHRSIGPEVQATCPSCSSADRRYRNDKREDFVPSRPVDIVALVRSLQRTAGLNDCFKRGDANCAVLDCAWRAHCLGTMDFGNK